MTYEVVWNGAKDRRGECKSLTGYTGPSSLLNHPPDKGLSLDELIELQRALGVRSRPIRRTRLQAQRERRQRERDQKARRSL